MQQRFLRSSALSGILLSKACEGKMNRAIEDSVCKATMVSHKRLEHLLNNDLKGMALCTVTYFMFSVIGIALQVSYFWTSCVDTRGHAIRLLSLCLFTLKTQRVS